MKGALIVATLAAAQALTACGGGTTSSDRTATAAAGVASTAVATIGAATATATQAASAPTVAATQAASAPTATSAQATSDGNAPGIPELHGQIVTTASGLRYIDETVGDGAMPAPTDTVTVNYTQWLADGTKLDSSVDRGHPNILPLDKVLPGLAEGIESMKVGGKRRLIIPPALADGDAGNPPLIPGGATLIFDVELLSIN